jgi:hypothetical protein
MVLGSFDCIPACRDCAQDERVFRTIVGDLVEWRMAPVEVAPGADLEQYLMVHG